MQINQALTLLVTGGASGLGAAVAQHFIEQQANVAVLDLPREGNAEKVKAISEKILFCPTDITKADQVTQAIAQIEEKFGPLRAAINCAGIATAGKILSHGEPANLEVFSKVIEVNLIGTFNVCRLAAAAMAKHEPINGEERGVLINTASVAAYEGQKGQTAYAASKGGIVSLTLPMARDLANVAIRAVTIAPGIFKTPMLASLPEAAQEALAKQMPFPKRLGDPKEYAQLAQHIIENPMLNGEVIRLDAALRLPG